MGLRSRLLAGMLLVLFVSVGLVGTQAVLLFEEDKSSYVYELSASQAARIADRIEANIRHLVEKMRIFGFAVTLRAPEGRSQREVLSAMLQQYPEFLLFSRRLPDGTIQEIFRSPALEDAGLAAETLHGLWRGQIPFDRIGPDRPFVADLTETHPTFTLAVRAAGGDAGTVLLAECSDTRLHSGHGQSRLFDVHITDSRGTPWLSVVSGERVSPDGAGVSFADLIPEKMTNAGTRSYESNGVPMLAAYAPAEGLGLWAVVQIPRERAFEAARVMARRSVMLAALVCVLGVGLVLIFAASITRPLTVLSRATEQIGRGQYQVDIPPSVGGEIGALAERFRRMGAELSAREAALKEAHTRLVESEKMTALGHLGAGIAHEVKNPLTSIRGYAQMGQRKLPESHPLSEYFRTIEKETTRSLDILKNLLRFARQETAEMHPTDLNAVIQDTVKLVQHQLEMHKVALESDLSADRLVVTGNANQIQQVLLNLFMNAGDAMENGGRVLVTSRAEGDRARIEVSDNGSGMPPGVLGRIFDPFFTTKSVGKGTGLGLSVSYGIVQEHKGEITARSKPGEGTTFTLFFPLMTEGCTEAATVQAGQPQARVISLR